MIQTQRQLSNSDLDYNKNVHYNSNGNHISNGNNAQTTFEKLVDDLKNDPAYKKEMIFERLIGFYRIGSEIGTGNFSQVKLGLHLLTKGKRFLIFKAQLN
jgi:hypothetical protein